MKDRSLCLDAVSSLEHLPGALFHRFAGAHAVTVRDPDDLWEQRDQLPVPFVDDIHRVFDVARELAKDHLLVSPTIDDPIAESVGLLLDDPARFRLEHERCAGLVGQAFQEFVGKDGALPMIDPILVAATEARLSDAFGGRAAPQIRAWLAPRALQFAVRFHRRRCDLVVFHPRSGRLAVSAPDPWSTAVYVAAFGQLIADDEEWFSAGAVVCLEPLAWRGRESLRPTRGVSEVRLVEVGLHVRNEWGEITVIRATDAVPALERRAGELRHARLELRVGSDWRTVTLDVPDRLAYDWRQDGEVVRDFLEERGFLAGPDPEPLCRAA